ncbi:E2 domain-containing protein [Mesorhizobium sp. IMUNJ 23033]|uniref:E2 domain-containing protein n=1 Tax=Mesorhizobium sp. IMUNJ 23033 TaxID=3378039 RepID=UPI00384EC21C
MLSTSKSGFEVSLPVARTGGDVITYGLHVEVGGQSATVREVSPTNLPGFCPERHINVDGTFCLYWQPVDGIAIETRDAALEWWATVVAFLKLQARAARLRRWPNRRGRAHGDAAHYQHAAEEAANIIGGTIERAMREGNLSVAKGTRRANGRALRLLRGKRRVVSIWEETKRVVALRRPCICESQARPLAMVSCGEHAAAAALLVLSLQKMEKAEAEFNRQLAGHECCGTMNDCPLKKAA